MATQLHLEDFDWRSSPERMFSQGDSMIKSTGVSPASSSRVGLGEESRKAEGNGALEHWKQRARLFQEALAQETKRNERIEQENVLLTRENLHLRQSYLTPASTPSLSQDIEHYLQFAVSVVDAVADLRVLFYGRVERLETLENGCREGKWQEICLKLLQVLSDFVVYYRHKGQGEKGEIRGREEMDREKKGKEGIDRESQNHMHTPSLSALIPTSNQPLFTSKSPAVIDRALSPGFHPAPSNDYNRLYDEHRSLLASLNSQSDRLTRLNHQLTATMSSSKRLLASRPGLSPYRPQKDPSFELIPAVTVLPPSKPTISLPPSDPSEGITAEIPSNSPSSQSKSPPRRSKYTVYKSKPASGKRVEPLSRGQSGSRHCQGVREEGWTSVGDYFKAGKEEKERKEE